MKNAIVIYSANDSERLKYVLDLLFTEWFGIPYTLTTNENDVSSLPFFISYGKVIGNGVCIPDAGLLWQTGIAKQKINIGTWDEVPVLFAVDSPDYSLPFDILSAIFFLVSRYEEYYTYTPDKYNRYPATESILHNNGCLERPIVDEWVMQLKNMFAKHVNTAKRRYSFQPTYDIDIAYSYRAKGLKRTTGAYVRDILSANVKGISRRIKVLSSTDKDPYDAFDWLQQLHSSIGAKSIYFILAALRTTTYDKNISPQHADMQSIIKKLAKTTTIGLHPSYYSEEQPELWDMEKNTMENISGQSIRISRQHYIRMQLPYTYERLAAKSITDDYSMGYGTHSGFRAGTGKSFKWYNLKEETATALRIHPFCFMDTTAKYEELLTATEAFNKLNRIAAKLKAVNSKLVTIFHNFSLGTDKEWAGWREQYEQFIKEQFSKK